jgi:hypothetical protein
VRPSRARFAAREGDDRGTFARDRQRSLARIKQFVGRLAA